MTLKTHRFRVDNHVDIEAFSFRASEHVPSLLLSWLSQWLSERIDSGTEFRSGQTIQLGFWQLLCEIENRHLRLQAPLTTGDELAWQADVSDVLRATMVHKYVPESFGADIDIPSMSQTVTVGTRFSEFPMLASRLPKVDDELDSGWAFGNTSDEVDNNGPEQLSVMPLWEALKLAPWVHDYLSLPPGMQVYFESETPKVLQDYEPVAALSGSYFESLQGG